MKQDAIPSWASHLFAVGTLLACTWTCLFVLGVSGFEGNWYRLDKALALEIGGPFVHRVLFVLVAHGFLSLAPHLSVMEGFTLSQIVALVLSLAAMRRWTGLFVGDRWAVVGPFLMVLILVPTIRYHTFYDFGIVFFFAAGLYALFTRRIALYLVLLTIGTVNHEIVLLLVGVFCVLEFDRMPPRRFLLLLAAQLALHTTVRAILLAAIPWSDWQPLRLHHNVGLLFDPDRGLIVRGFDLVFWYGLAALGFLFADRDLRRASVLIPMVLATTLVFGQFHELRQFNAVIPVITALILVFVIRGRPTDSLDARESLLPDVVQAVVAIVVGCSVKLLFG